MRARFDLDRRAATEWATYALMIPALALLVGELYVTAVVRRPDLLHPTSLRNDASTYVAAGERLNAGHLLYGSLLPGDRTVGGYPRDYPARSSVGNRSTKRISPASLLPTPPCSRRASASSLWSSCAGIPEPRSRRRY